MDTGYEPLGAVDPFGRIKAPYWAYWMYSQMPEQRVQIMGLPKANEFGLHAMASADKETACILAWNDNAKSSVNAEININKLPFTTGRVEVYVMNDAIDPYWNTNDSIDIMPQDVIAAEEFGTAVSIDLPAGGFVMYRFVKSDPAKANAEPIGELIRKRYYFPERGKSSYSFYDETDHTVYLGMNGEHSARSIVATEWKGLPDILVLQSKFGGKYQNVDLNTSFSVRVDYSVNGEYTKAVLYTFMPINQRRDCTVPWGTQREPDEVVLTETLLTGKSLLTIGFKAPENWDGRAIITFDMHSMGPDVWTELTMKSI